MENKTDIKPSYNILLLVSFIGYAEGSSEMLLNVNCAVRVPRYRRDVTISALRYIEDAVV